MELSSIFSINDNNYTSATFYSIHCLSFYNEKGDPDINFQNIFNANTLCFPTEQFASIMHDAKCISIIDINCRSSRKTKNTTRQFRICL